MSWTSLQCRRSAAFAAVVLHAGAAIGVLSMSPVEPQHRLHEPIIVHWISNEPLAPVEPSPPVAVVKPKTKPAPKLPAVQPAWHTTPPVQIAATAAPEQKSQTEIPAEVPAAEPVPAPSAVSASPPQPSVAAVPELPISPPSFNADYLHNPAPAYPASARRNGETGRVVLRVLVTAIGTAERVELRTSSGSRRLDSAALETVQRWRFVPARRGETPVSAWVLVPISFALEG